MIEIQKLRDIEILYVENNDKIRNHLYPLFKQIYGTVYQTSRGIDALNIFKKNNNIDIIIFDIELKDINGIEFLKQIKQIKPNIKIIVITSCTNSDVLIESINNGVNFYETKPINVKKIFDNIHTLYFKIKSSEIIINQKKENEKLLDIINDISITLILDNEFNTIKHNLKYESFANLEKSFLDNICLESKNLILKELDNNITFSGKIVFDNEDCKIYTNAFIIPTIENGYLKYIVIAIENSEYLKLREDNQKKLSFLSKHKIESYSKDKEIKDLKDEIFKIKSEVLDGTNSFVVEENKYLNLKIKKLNQQIVFLEEQIKDLNNKHELNNIETIERLRLVSKNSLNKYQETLKNLKEEIKNLNKELTTIKSLKFDIYNLKKREKDLMALITHYELQISHLKKNKIN